MVAMLQPATCSTPFRAAHRYDDQEVLRINDAHHLNKGGAQDNDKHRR